MNDFSDYCELIYENLETIRKKSENLFQDDEASKGAYSTLLSGIDKGFYLLERYCLQEKVKTNSKKIIHEASNIYSVIRGAIFILKLKNREDFFIVKEIEKLDKSIDSLWDMLITDREE